MIKNDSMQFLRKTYFELNELFEPKYFISALQVK